VTASLIVERFDLKRNADSGTTSFGDVCILLMLLLFGVLVSAVSFSLIIEGIVGMVPTFSGVLPPLTVGGVGGVGRVAGVGLVGDVDESVLVSSVVISVVESVDIVLSSKVSDVQLSVVVITLVAVVLLKKSSLHSKVGVSFVTSVQFSQT